MNVPPKRIQTGFGSARRFCRSVGAAISSRLAPSVHDVFAAAEKTRDQRRIELRPCTFLQSSCSHVMTDRRLIRLPRGHGHPCVGDLQHPRGERNLISSEPARIAFAVDALVMAKDRL